MTTGTLGAMANDDVKPIMIPMPVLPTSSSTSTTAKKRPTKKRAAKKRVAKKKAVKRRVATSLEAEIRELASHSKIQAIKVYRERTGTSLREAKEAVEAIVG